MPAKEATKPALTRRQIAAVCAGNGLEFYDFVTYSFFAVQIGRSLFPGDAPHSLLLSLATFGVGFVSRPLGGLVIGRLADRRGRKPAMILSFTLMGIAITGLALTPSYALIGMAAPVLAVTFRLIQGFALGGEVGPNAAFLLEAAPAQRRALYVSMHAATADAAALVAGLIGLGLSAWLSSAALDAWGWRAAFLIGASIVPFGLALRRTLSETLPDAAEGAEAPATGRSAFPVIAAAGLMIIGAATISNYTLDYLATYAQDTLHMPTTSAFGAVIMLGLFGVIGDLSAGWLADRYGRKRVLVLPWLALLLLVLPAFQLLSALRTPAALLGATAALTLLHIFGSTPALILFIEALPARIRAGALGIVYAVAIAVFGGTTQIVVKALIDWTESPLAPAFYMMAAIVFGITGALLIREPRRQVPP
ncbi:MAG: MFS transporter [Sphingomonadaceae bacterium]|nr:MFS transporter [Sphingomonadaceae bacterium]